MISNDRKKENNAKKFAVDLFVELHSNDKAIFVVILFDLSVFGDGGVGSDGVCHRK